MGQIITGQNFEEERALYALKDAEIKNCSFGGPADGESALKEARDIVVRECSFSMRYPLWHTENFEIEDIMMDEKTRAPIWYSKGGKIRRVLLEGIKAIRECSDISIEDSKIISPEFGWKSKDITLSRTDIEAEYIFLESKNVQLIRTTLRGKYSCQYVDNMIIENCSINTKDAFWHSKNVTVRNSMVKGEYMGWYSENLTFENCKIIGTQPFCYCKNLRIINCTMEEADLAFEYSDVDADITGDIISVKNPKSGVIKAYHVGEIIRDNPVMECTGKVVERSK